MAPQCMSFVKQNMQYCNQSATILVRDMISAQLLRFDYNFLSATISTNQCGMKSGTYLAGESPAAEEEPASLHSESCVVQGNENDEA
jgi:hypothetical protein